jgi:hypothetical protein
MIIKEADHNPDVHDILNYFPDQFVSEEKKTTDKTWIKNTLDFFANIAFAQYRKNKGTISLNYKYLKGDIDWKYFYQNETPVPGDFLSQITPQQALPSHIRHYPIWNRPINTMLGELTKRPDNHRVRAFDDDSKSEEMEFKTQLVQQLIMQQARNQIMAQYAIEGQELNEQDLEELTVEKVKDYLTDYTSLAERWGNHVLSAMKAELSMKDKAEDAFRDLLVAAREFIHIYEDNSKRGFDVEVENPVHVFHSPNNNQKYSKHWYFGGIIKIAELSEIIEKVPGITKEEIDHLVEQVNSGNRLSVKSNLNSGKTGIDSIKYDTYYALEEQERDLLAAELEDSDNEQNLEFLQPSMSSPLSHKFTFMRVYFLSKKLIGKLTYVDQDGEMQTMMVDETYQEGSPNELAIEWGWVNQWYEGIRIGNEIYKMRPYKCLDYCPIIGVTHEIKNTVAKSMVDMLKNFQTIYDVSVNQLWELMEKEIGNVPVVNIRRIPVAKDSDNQDAIEEWEAEARARGILFEDDSPENMRVPSNNTNLTRPIDLNRAKEMAERRATAQWAKQEAMELVGMTDQRMGNVQATETLGGTQTALIQSFAQTEPYFAQHEYVMDQVYQGILDMCQYIESNKPQSTLSYITSAGESAFIQVTPEDIRLRDLHVFATSRAEDQQLFQELRQLAQPMLQNGATPYEIAQLFSTNSIRQLKQTFKQLKEEQQDMFQQSQQLEQQKLTQNQEIAQAQLQEQARQHQLSLINENIEREKDRRNKLEIAIIGAMGRAQATGTDANQDGVLDIYQTQDLINQYNSQLQQAEANIAKLSLEREKLVQEGQFRKKELEQRDKEIENQRKNDQNDLRISQMKIQQEKIKLQAAKYKAQEAKNKPKPSSKK